MRLPIGAKTAKLFWLGPINHVKMRIVTGVSDKPGCMQMNDARAKDLIDCTQVSRARNQPNPLIREQGKGGSIRDRLRGKGEQRSSGITSQ